MTTETSLEPKKGSLVYIRICRKTFAYFLEQGSSTKMPVSVLLLSKFLEGKEVTKRNLSIMIVRKEGVKEKLGFTVFFMPASTFCK